MDAKISRLNFSKRQMQVLLLIAEGRTTKEIAFELGISNRTVLSYTAYLRNLTGAYNNAHLVRICADLGIFSS